MANPALRGLLDLLDLRLRFHMIDTVDLHHVPHHALADGLVVAVRAEHEEHVVRVVGVGRGHALVVDLRLVREGEVPLRLFSAARRLWAARRQRAGAERAEGPGGQHCVLPLRFEVFGGSLGSPRVQLFSGALCATPKRSAEGII